MENIITRNVFMAIGAWTVVVYEHYDPAVKLWQFALGLTLGAALYCVTAAAFGVER
jgi:ABC-type branched-subunit amino acid transport system permease subunit